MSVHHAASGDDGSKSLFKMFLNFFEKSLEIVVLVQGFI